MAWTPTHEGGMKGLCPRLVPQVPVISIDFHQLTSSLSISNTILTSTHVLSAQSSTNPSNLATTTQSVFKFQLPFTAGKQKCQETRTCQPTPGRSPVAIPPLRWRGRLVQHAGRCGVRANGCHQPPQTCSRHLLSPLAA